MTVQVLAVVALLGNGIVAGVFFAVAVSVLPTLFALPAGRYVETHRLLGRGYHPAMPLIVNAATVSALALVFLVHGMADRLLFLTAGVLLIGVQAVSHLGNVPLNRSLHGIDPERLPSDWLDPRPRWRNWHRLRTALALVALVLTSTATALLHA
ncbi:DUF1772 domain-containing protein [Actinoallomurus sp. NPDC052274]|uniref:anthrone oxygenase family protein n=1 Tax=Actinoallomurus sp. NPDC052274 TaxID=3155420 RepID=UPI003434F0BC